MTNKSKKSRFLVVILVASLCVVGFTFRDRLVDEGILLILGGADTVYAKGYSERRFNDVLVGQSKEEVIELLGPPLAEWTFDIGSGQTELVMEYSESKSDSHYRIRLIFVVDGRVVEKKKGIHFD